MNNAVYNKSMENMKNRIDVKSLSNEKYFLKCTSKPKYVSYKICDNDLVAIPKGKVRLTLKKTAYVEICIIDLSKVRMYAFHYYYMKKT